MKYFLWSLNFQPIVRVLCALFLNNKTEKFILSLPCKAKLLGLISSLQYKIDSKCFKMTSDYAMISNWPMYDTAWVKTHGLSSSRLVFLFKLCSEHVTFVQISILQNTIHIAKQYHNSVLKLARVNKIVTEQKSPLPLLALPFVTIVPEQL